MCFVFFLWGVVFFLVDLCVTFSVHERITGPRA